jgi:RNA polymerase sigma-70 factor (ECF subfamily)
MNEAKKPDVPPESEGSKIESSRISRASVSFGKLVSENLPFVWRSLRRFGVPLAEVDDAAQRVFMIASERLASIEPGSERSFLTAVALKVASHARRANQRRDAAHQRFFEHQSISLAPEGFAGQMEARDLLDVILNKMPEDLRSVFVLFELEQLTIDEVAELLSLPRGTVATRLRRARMVFKDAAKSIEARTRGGKS